MKQRAKGCAVKSQTAKPSKGGVKIRGTGAATKGTKARGPMA